MIQAACCCGGCKSECAYRFFHTWTCEIETVYTTEFFRTRSGYDVGKVPRPIPDGPPGVEIVAGKSVTTVIQNVSQSGTVYYTKGSKLKIQNIEGANSGASRPPDGCEISFAGIPDLVTSGTRTLSNIYERDLQLTNQGGTVSFCSEPRRDVYTENKDGRPAFAFPETGEGLECMNNTAPFMIPIIEGYMLTGEELAYRAKGSDPECHPPNPGVFRSYPECADAIGAHNFSSQAKFTVTPYEGMEQDRFYFRRWKAMPLSTLYDENQFFWYDDTAETYIRLERLFDKNGIWSYYRAGIGGGCRFGPNGTFGEYENENTQQLPDGFSNELFRTAAYSGVFPDGNCGVRDHLLGIWSEENGPPPVNPFGVNCVNSGPDPETWEGGWGRGPIVPGRNVEQDYQPASFSQGPLKALATIGCPCTLPTPVPCDGVIDPRTECPADPEDPTAYPIVTAWEAWNALGGSDSGSSNIQVEYPYYADYQNPSLDIFTVWSGTVNVSMSFRWTLNIENVVSSNDGEDIEAPCQ